MRKPLPKKDAIINRVRRIPVVVFLKRITPILIFLILLSLSFLFGLWQVRNVRYNTEEFVNVSRNELDDLVHEYIGRNIFSVKPSSVQRSIIKGTGYVKDVYVKKILPSTLDIHIKEYTPTYIGYSADNCILFAELGEQILKVCSECELECTTKGEELSLIYISSSSLLENMGKLIFFDEVYKIYTVLSLFNYQIVSIDINDGVSIFYDIEGHMFVFDISYELDEQLARMYLVCQRIDSEQMEFKSLDVRFERPVMKFK